MYIADNVDDFAVAAALFISIVVNRNTNLIKYIYTNSILFENDKLQPITPVSVDHVLRKIDLGTKHVIIAVVFAWHTFRRRLYTFSEQFWNSFKTVLKLFPRLFCFIFISVCLWFYESVACVFGGESEHARFMILFFSNSDNRGEECLLNCPHNSDKTDTKLK